MHPPRLSFAVDTPASLLERLASVDISVPPLTEGRTTQHCEQYLMARVLATLAESPELQYPLDLLHREKPDFSLSVGGRAIGIECVEAVPEEWNKIAAIRDANFPDAPVFLPMLKPGKRVFSIQERVAIARGEKAGPPWVGKMAERQWAEAIAFFISKKTRKLRARNYGEFDRHWLLMQDEWRVPLNREGEKQEAAELCLPMIDALLAPPSFERIYISSGEYLIRLAPGPVALQPIRDLWRNDG